ncbi:MAG: recombinase family protein [Bacilli bacterium]|nr:recombinase family protein [Bacilli bacterium]
MNKEGMKCAIYVRVSTEMQVDGFSLDAQINTLKRYAEREGMIIVDTYEDAGKSGKSIEGRPSFKKLLDDIKNGLDIKYVLVYKLSRFGRNAADILNSIELIQSYDINLIATEEGIDSSQTSGKLLISVLSAVSEIERENILEQTMNGRREKARQGGWNGGFAPYGYELVNGEFIIIPDEADDVREIYDLFVNENLSYRKIAHKLNLQGKNKELKKNRSLTSWSNDAVKGIIRNPIYKGTIAFGRRTKVKIRGTRDEYARVETDKYIMGQGKHEAIISEELWNQAQEKIKSRSKTGPNPAYARSYLLSGLLRCPCCGGRMSSAVNQWKTIDGTAYSSAYYRCRNAWNETGHYCDYKYRFDMKELDDFIISFVKNTINKGLFAEKIKEEFKQTIDVSHLLKEKKQYESKLSQVLNNKQMLENKIDYMPIDTPHRDQKLEDYNKRLDELYDVVDEIENCIKDVDKKIRGIENSSKNYDFIMANLEAFESLFDKMDDIERRKMITMLIKEINIDSETQKIKSIKFNFDLSSDNNEEIEKNISFDLDVDNGVEGIGFREVLNKKSPIRTKLPHYRLETDETDKVKKVDRIPVPRKEHYCRKQATYAQIKGYIKEKYNLNIHSTYIAEIKRKYGVDMQATRLIDDAKHVNCPKEKADAIIDALKHFNII